MGLLLKRPEITFAPRGGLLRCEYFQTAYVTSDLDRACEVFSRRYGISAFYELGANFPNGSAMRGRLAWVGGHMVELIEAVGPGMEFYYNRLPAGEFAIRFHHQGYILPDEKAWQELETEIVASDWKVLMAQDMSGFLRMNYVLAPELDHYLEFFLLYAGGVAMFEAVPAS